MHNKSLKMDFFVAAIGLGTSLSNYHKGALYT